jgi:hypothetical protein
MTHELALKVIIGGAALALIGVAYDWWVERLERHGHDRGYMGFIVAGGELLIYAVAFVTLWGITAPAQALLVILLGYQICAGLPMIWGSVSRFNARRQAEEERARALGLTRLGDGDLS